MKRMAVFFKLTIQNLIFACIRLIKNKSGNTLIKKQAFYFAMKLFFVVILRRLKNVKSKVVVII